MLLPETATTGACQLAERLRASLAAAPVRSGRLSLTITASFGMVANDSVLTPDQLVRAADESLYAAKSAGRNCVRSAVVV